MPERVRRNYRWLILPALGVVFFDQLTKQIIIKSLNIYETVPVIQGFFDLVHVRNRGMAFGIMNDAKSNSGTWLLLAMSSVAIVLLLVWFFRLKDEGVFFTLSLSLILGGAVGNIIDRLRFGEVVDFLDVYVGAYHWPAFNVADAAITVGTFMIAANLLFARP
ncbi:MAG TPA: signal peptidase II, partial [Deltaproteobacteria bacterium]|nr:signal peptidase II [Deltaproteobacteria bacterium]